MVPTRTTSANTVRIRLLAKNDPSRDQNESSRGADATRWERVANRAKEPARTSTRKPSSTGPIADWVNEWTEVMVPDRVRKVPKIVRANADITRTKFHACSIPRRCWTSEEWMRSEERRVGKGCRCWRGAEG